VQLTLEPGASVAEVARAHGVNANQVFTWRRAFERGELIESCALLPVTVSSSGEPASDIAEQAAESHPSSGGSIHIEFPGGVMSSVETRVRNRRTRYDLIIIDELGYVVMPDAAAELLFQVIALRAENQP
jgi:transposase